MFEQVQSPEDAAIPTAEELLSLIARLGGAGPGGSDAERIDLIAVLESLKGAAAAAQARLTVAFDVSQRAEQAAQGLPARKQGLGVPGQVALARRDSPHRGARHLGLATALVREMPHTLAALSAGRISEWRATILVRQTAVLSAVHRARVDAELADRLETLGDRGVEREAKKLAYQLDPGSVLRRTRRAEADRRVTIRPAPDTMSYLTGLLPVAQGVAVHATLTRHADTLRAAGDPRSRGQIMADTLVERVTGQATASGVPVEIQLVMTDRALLAGDHTPARIVGYGPIPAALARSLVLGPDTDTDSGTSHGTGSDAGTDAMDAARVWVRRLYTHPTTGQLVAMDSRRREFPGMLRKLLVIRDEVCRTPWCDAPIRHADHVRRAADGGETSADNGQGLCEACNHAKEAPGWQTTTSRAGPRPTITVHTPTGHHYTSTAPDLPGHPEPPTGARHHTRTRHSIIEEHLKRLVAA